MKNSTKFAKRTLTIILSAIIILSIALLTSCKNPENEISSFRDGGTIILSVNPEIRIDYDKNGIVTSVSGNNEDGKAIIKDMTDLLGKDCSAVMEQLIKKINGEGYFIEEIEGERKNIVIRIEPGSALPEKNFVENLGKDVQQVVDSLKVSSDLITINPDDYDDKYSTDDAVSRYITLDKAKEIALAHAEVAASDARFEDREFDFDDGRAIYELEFKAGGYEYEYDINAVNGDIVKFEKSKENGRNNDDDKLPTDNTTYIGLDKAKEIALAHAGVNATDARFEDIEFDLDDGSPLYELEFKANGYEYEYDVHAVTGQIMKSEKDKEDDRKNNSNNTPAVTAGSPSSNNTPSTYIGIDKAKEIALAHASVNASDARFEDREFDLDNGSPLYEIEFKAGGYEYEYYIDAISGNILKSEKDRDD